MPKDLFIEYIRRDSDRFYQLLGPVFGSRSIAKEVGIHAYDDADKQWIGGFELGELVGWLSHRKSVISDCYVLQSHRRKGVLANLLSVAIKDFGSPLRACCTAKSVGVFANAGFREIRRTTNFVHMVCNNA